MNTNQVKSSKVDHQSANNGSQHRGGSDASTEAGLLAQVVSQVEHKVVESGEKLVDMAEKNYKFARSYATAMIKERPFTAIGIGLGVGIGLGFMFFRSK